MTLGGPIYCNWLRALASYLDAIRLCPDYGRNGESSGATRKLRMEDWGDPVYLDAVAGLPGRLRRQGVKISKLALIGPSYAGYANAELVATHPSLRPSALIVVDSYFDLLARYAALPLRHETRAEMETVLGGKPGRARAAYLARSPSSHLPGLARAIQEGMRLVVVWSVSPVERRFFRGATCSRWANAEWLRRLSGLLGRPVTAYVTSLEHAVVLGRWGEHLVALAGLVPPFETPLPARVVSFSAGAPVPKASYCH